MLSFWNGFDTVLSEDVSDCRIGNVEAQVGQSALDAVVAPGGILPGHAEDEPGDLIRNWRSARRLPFAVAVVPFLGDKPMVPTEDRVGGYNGGQLHHRFATQSLALDGQYPALVIGQEDAFPSHLVHQGLDLGVLELDDLLLPPVDPAG